MTTQRTLRRKLQKKMKHKPYRKCPKCGGRMGLRLVDGPTGQWCLLKYCGGLVWRSAHYAARPVQQVSGRVDGCGHLEELFWTGGGTGRRIPDGASQHGKGASCGGSNPSPSFDKGLIIFARGQ